MKTFNANRLKSARLLAGLSLRQLEEKLLKRVSHNAINKYEIGQMQPETGTIIRLAEVLSIPVAYLFATTEIELGQIDFRKKSNLTKNEIEQIKIKTRDKVERYLQAENLLGISKKFNNPISRKQIKEVERAEEMAEIVRSEWGLGINPISNVIEMLEEHEVKVIEVEASDKFDGLSTYVDEIPVAVINENFSVERKQVRKILGDKRKNIALGELVAIKEEYGISAQAAMRRAFDLEIISASAYKFFCMRMAGNKKEEGLGSFKGEEKSYRLMQLVFRLFAEGVLDENKAALLSGMSLMKFRALFNNIPEKDLRSEYSTTTAFANAWGEDEPEYTDDDLIKINPNYEGW